MNSTPAIAIKASTTRRANGWAAVLEFPNGGRQMFSARHGTMESAQREANHALKARLTYPASAIPDPQANALQDLSTYRA